MKPLTAALAALTLFSSPARSQVAAATTPSGPANTTSGAVSSGDAEWSLRVGPRLVAALRSSSVAERARALHVVGNLAYASQEGADLRPAVPALLDVFRTDPDARLRVMALRSLEAAADEGVMAALRADVPRQTDPYVQRTLLAVLADHYGVEALRHDDDVVDMAQSLLDRSRR